MATQATAVRLRRPACRDLRRVATRRQLCPCAILKVPDSRSVAGSKPWRHTPEAVSRGLTAATHPDGRRTPARSTRRSRPAPVPARSCRGDTSPAGVPPGQRPRSPTTHGASFTRAYAPDCQLQRGPGLENVERRPRPSTNDSTADRRPCPPAEPAVPWITEPTALGGPRSGARPLGRQTANVPRSRSPRSSRPRPRGRRSAPHGAGRPRRIQAADVDASPRAWSRVRSRSPLRGRVRELLSSKGGAHSGRCRRRRRARRRSEPGTLPRPVAAAASTRDPLPPEQDQAVPDAGMAGEGHLDLGRVDLDPALATASSTKTRLRT